MDAHLRTVVLRLSAGSDTETGLPRNCVPQSRRDIRTAVGRLRRKVVAVGVALQCPQYTPKRQVEKSKRNGVVSCRPTADFGLSGFTASKQSLARHDY